MVTFLATREHRHLVFWRVGVIDDQHAFGTCRHANVVYQEVSLFCCYVP